MTRPPCQTRTTVLDPTTVPGPNHRARPNHRAGPTHLPSAHPCRSPGDPLCVLGSGTKQKTQGSENSRGCAAVWRGALSPQVHLLHRAILRLSKGCGQPRRLRASRLPCSTGAVVHSPTPSTAPGASAETRCDLDHTNVSAEVSAISIRGPGSLASACRTHSPTQDLLSNTHIKHQYPLDTSRASAPSAQPTRRILSTSGLCARYMPLPPARPTKNRATRASVAPGARQARNPAPKTAVLQSLMSEALSVEEVQAVSYTHLTLPTSDLV